MTTSVLPMPGRHNVSNATAAIAVAHELGSTGRDPQGLASFGGVKRRFTRTGAGTAARSSTITATIRSRSAVLRGPPGLQGPRRRRSRSRTATRGCATCSTISRLLQRCRHGDRRAGLCGRRGADRGREFATLVARIRPAAIATRASFPGPRRSRR
jgi:hypothetical protein